jgi:hypothetical protein
MAAVILMDVVVRIQSSGDVMQCLPLPLNTVLTSTRSCMHTVCLCWCWCCCLQALAEDSKVDDDVKSKIVAGLTDRILVASIGPQIAAALEQVCMYTH